VGEYTQLDRRLGNFTQLGEYTQPGAEQTQRDPVRLFGGSVVPVRRRDWFGPGIEVTSDAGTWIQDACQDGGEMDPRWRLSARIWLTDLLSISGNWTA